VFGQNVTEHNLAPSPSGHPLLSGPPTLNDIHQIFTLSICLHSYSPFLRDAAPMASPRRPLRTHLTAALLALHVTTAREVMRGFGSTVMQDSDAAILDSLRELYSQKLRPLEEKGRYNQMREPALGDAWFDSKPMVLLIGQYSVGKTSFIRYLLGRDFPGAAFRIGPEPTTERFVAVMYGDQDKTTPGNALASQPDTPFHSLKKFGTNFLDRLESTQLPSPILKRVVRAASPL
jgi:hypothetical protein